MARTEPATEVTYLGEWPARLYQVVAKDADASMVLSEDEAFALLEQLVRALCPGQTADEILARLP